jgi:hypothetical protein
MHHIKLRRVRCAIAIVAALGAALSGCTWFGSDDQSTTPLGFPRSWIWYAAPGTSLQSPNAKAVRGWAESQRLYQDARVSYPGFTGATAPELLSRMNAADSPEQSGGTERYLIRSITITGSELRASLCVDGWDEFGFLADGSFLDAQPELNLRSLVMHKGGPTSTVPADATHQALVAVPRAAPSPTLIGREPYGNWLKGPTENVFGGWMAVSWDVSVDPPADCIAWFNRNHPGLRFPTGYTNEARPNRPASAPAPTLAPSPGW